LSYLGLSIGVQWLVNHFVVSLLSFLLDFDKHFWEDGKHLLVEEIAGQGEASKLFMHHLIDKLAFAFVDNVMVADNLGS
jgi:hypothetical protein